MPVPSSQERKVSFGTEVKDLAGLKGVMDFMSYGEHKTINHNQAGVSEDWKQAIFDNECVITHTGIGSFTIMKKAGIVGGG